MCITGKWIFIKQYTHSPTFVYVYQLAGCGQAVAFEEGTKTKTRLLDHMRINIKPLLFARIQMSQNYS